MSIGLPGTGPGFAVAPSDDPPAPGRWRILTLLSLAELLGMSLWFAATAVAPQLAERWRLSPAQTGWLTGIVQLGFVAGTATAAILNLADLIPARRYFAGAALLGAVANAGLVWAPNPAAALFSRFLVGFFLAGVYPPGMKMVATWFRSYRGLAIGTLVGALGIGKAMPYLVHAMRGAGMEQVILFTSAGAVLAALMVAAVYRDGPYPFARRPFAWSLVATVMRDRPTRLAIGGYLGHMWELYAMWTWLPAFLAASVAARAAAGHATLAPALVDLSVFGAFVAGGLGCVWGGWAAQRIGYARVVTLSMAISGACAATIGLAFGAPAWLLLPLVWLWGWFVVADSAQFSAMVTEAAPAHAVGTALTLQTSLGFLLTLATIQLVPFMVGRVGWPWAFTILALGPALGIAAIARLRTGGRSAGATVLLAASLAAGLCAPGNAADPPFTIEVVDVGGHPGGITSLAFDGHGKPHVSYMEYHHADLRYASRTPRGWTVETADSAAVVGGYSSLALDAAGVPHICYLEIGRGDLKLAVRRAGRWTTEIVDSAGNVGWHTSLALDRRGNPHISYFDVTRADLRYAARERGRWTIETVDSAGDVGRFTSLALDARGRPYISYYDARHGDLKLARGDGPGWRIETVDVRGTTGLFTSLALGRDGSPSISYHALAGDTIGLWFAAWAGGGWIREVVDVGEGVGNYTSLELDRQGRPCISYYDKPAGDLKLAWKSGGRWTTAVVDSAGHAGAYTSLAFDPRGRASISYTDPIEAAVRFAHGATPIAALRDSTGLTSKPIRR